MLVPPSSQQPPSTSQRRTSSAAYITEPGATPSPPRGATALRDELEAPIPLSSIHNGGGDDNGNGGSYARSSRDNGKNPPWEDAEALEYWLRAWAAGGPAGPSGDTLHRSVVLL